MESEHPSGKAAVILARAKAAGMVIGALATAVTASYGALRKPPEDGARRAYEVLTDALKEEQASRALLAQDVSDLRRYVLESGARQAEPAYSAAPPTRALPRGPLIQGHLPVASAAPAPPTVLARREPPTALPAPAVLFAR